MDTYKKRLTPGFLKKLFSGKPKATEEQDELDLEYKVSFPEGYKPVVEVHCADAESNRLYVVRANIGVEVAVGIRFESVEGNNPFEQQESVLKGSRFIITLHEQYFCIESRLVQQVPGDTANLGGSLENIEEEAYRMLQQKGINCIRVRKKEDMKGAVDRHVESYVRQFSALRESCMNLFEDYSAEHPGVIHYSAASKNTQED